MQKRFFLVLAPLLLAMTLCFSSCQSKAPQTFEVGEGSFLLDGKPFVVKAGELHFARIPREYWEHRIEMVKAQGMNAVCLYVFWNFHEPQPGEFNFEGQADVRAFVELCQKHGLYVILRPGPYCCAEWEMGGLPWWLLKKKDIQLRSMDEYFVERVRLFENALAEQLADLQLARGGNIIMVQVENEFGGYGTDKPYVAAVRDILREAGWTDVPLFQCDWSSNFENNALDDLLWTMNFGTGSNIDDQFRRLKELRPTTPLMCSEFWSGWFDNWGRAHETRDAKDMVAGLREMLEKNISFSLYMVHGGSSFGHWAGANSPGFQPDCSSYDYDAPISEAGHATPKFDELRAMLQEFTDEPLPPVPAPFPVKAIDAFTLTECAPLMANLPAPVVEDGEVQTFEELGMGWGSALYSTHLKARNVPSTLTIDAHDFAQVFVDGILVGRLDRRLGQKTIDLPATPNGAKLDILVEAMGRINYGRAIKDFKGIVAPVTITHPRPGAEPEQKPLGHWTIRLFPDDYATVSTQNYQPMNADTGDAADFAFMPAYYRGTFTVDDPADTYLDLSTWGKGQVWVNGHAIGRFWQIGPQQSLFMPGCWLKKGENEIIVLDVMGPSNPVIAGLENPILDQLREPTPVIIPAEGETWQGDGPGATWQGDGPGAL